MKYGIPELCRKSRNGNLSGDEINWVEHQLRHLPYFQINQIILAHQEHQVPSESPCIERGLLYSTNRKAMAALMNQDPEMDLFRASEANRIPLEKKNSPIKVIEKTIVPLPTISQEDPLEPITLEEQSETQIDTFESEETPLETPAIEAYTSPEIVIPEINQESGFEINSESNPEEPKAIETPEPVLPEKATRTLSAAELKIENKIKFRLQMFAWKIVQIRQQLEQKSQGLKGNSNRTSIQNERISSKPNITWAPAPELILEEIKGSFEPELSEVEALEENTILSTESSSIKPNQEISDSAPSPLLPDFIEVEIPTKIISEEIEITLEEENSSELEASENPSENSEPGVLHWQHNRMMLDIQISSSDSEKYFSKSLKPSTPEKNATSVKTAQFRKRPDRRKVLDIIDKFIELEPEISIKARIPEGKQEDISRRSITDEGELVSETLAQIYLKQGNKNKAVKIYEILKLKFPEKSAYFESLLQKLG